MRASFIISVFGIFGCKIVYDVLMVERSIFYQTIQLTIFRTEPQKRSKIHAQIRC